jgi:hypothetical protein
MKIFVSIASYCDPLLKFTVESAIRHARYPENLHFGVVDQSPIDQPRLKLEDGSPSKLSYIHINQHDSRGVCWARSLAMTLYANEDWYFQIDSHTYFDPNWDETFINWATKLAEGRRKVVISSYPAGFDIENGEPVCVTYDGVLVQTISQGASFKEDDPRLPIEGKFVDTKNAISGFLIGGGCIFANGKIVYEVPYDPFFYFVGEEQSLALRLFTKGWDIFHIPHAPIYHLYNTPEAKSPKRTLHWDAAHDEARSTRWYELDGVSKNRFTNLVQGKIMGAYGLGTYRTIEDYANYSGIDYANRTVGAQAHTERPMFEEPSKEKNAETKED